MNFDSPDLLYELLPEEYRLQDAREGYRLRSLLEVIGGQVRLAKADIDRLLENLFIETAQPWVIPYLGDLVGSLPLEEVPRGARADVARTIAWRRRTGTIPMLEEMARTVTGWDARAVDFYRHLGWTQSLNHLRPEAHRTPDLRNRDRLDLLDTPFDTTTRTADLRPAAEGNGRHSLSRTAFFLWRLGAYPVTGGRPAPAAAGDTERYHFSPLGLDMPLFHLPRAGAEEADSPELLVRGPIRPGAFRTMTDRFCGAGGSLAIYAGGALLEPEQILPADLSQWCEPPPGKVAVDTALGRFRFAPGEGRTDVTVSYAYGFSHDLGGGPYTRPAAPVDLVPATMTVQGGGAALTDALNRWLTSGQAEAVIEILDSDTYSGAFRLELPAGARVVIRSAQGQCPVLTVTGDSRNMQLNAGTSESSVHLAGLWVNGGLRVNGNLHQLTLSHCTLVPSDKAVASLFATSADSSQLRIAIDHCITGPLRCHDRLLSLTVSDSIIDGLNSFAIAGALATTYAPKTILSHVTLLGYAQVQALEANGVLFTAPLRVQRLQTGSVRYSLVPPGSVVPRQYRCLTDPVPAFTSTRFGDPGYGQLSLTCPEAIRTGAEDGAELGFTHELKQPQRERNLKARLRQYLPVGRDPGLIYVT